MSQRQEFQACLQARGPHGAWVSLTVPFDVAKLFGTKGRVSVHGTVNGCPYRNSLMPNGDGTHSMMVNKELRAGAGASAGDVVDVVMEKDVAARTVQVPPELAACLAADSQAGAVFASLSVSHRAEFAEWVGAGKKPETRATRAAKAAGMIITRQRVK